MSSQNRQLLSCYGVKFFPEKFCKRVRIFTGTLCNLKCEFCYQRKDHNSTVDFEFVKKQIDYYHSLGFTSFDFSGGEPTILKDFPKYIEYAHKFGTVSCLSNGQKFSDINFLAKCKDLGLSEILFSIHTSNSKLYHDITSGSFEKLHRAICNAKSLDLLIRLNVTVYDKSDLSNFAQYVNNIKPYQVNFIELNYFEEAQDYNLQNSLKNCEKIKECIDKIDKDIEINVRYAPFCYMQGYEKYVKNYFQHLYDTHDWSMISYSSESTTLENRDSKCIEIARHQRMQNFYKHDECLECAYYYICDGVKNKNLKVFPFKAEKIRSILVN